MVRELPRPLDSLAVIVRRVYQVRLKEGVDVLALPRKRMATYDLFWFLSIQSLQRHIERSLLKVGEQMLERSCFREPMYIILEDLVGEPLTPVVIVAADCDLGAAGDASSTTLSIDRTEKR
jgi:hypothetical protein